MSAVLSRPFWAFADASRLEWVKWLAVASMLCDHLALTLLPDQQWLRHLGTFAFPAFMLSFGVGLAATFDPLRVAGRLILPAVIAQAAWVFIDGGWHPWNVLFVCGLAAAALWAFDEWGPWVTGFVYGSCALLMVLSRAEGGVFGFLFIAAAYWAARGWWYGLIAVCVAWLYFVPSVGAALAVAAVVFAPRGLVRLPRKRGLLSWVYAGHLSLFWALK